MRDKLKLVTINDEKLLKLLKLKKGRLYVVKPLEKNKSTALYDYITGKLVCHCNYDLNSIKGFPTSVSLKKNFNRTTNLELKRYILLRGYINQESTQYAIYPLKEIN